MSTATLSEPTTISTEEEWPAYGYIIRVRDNRLDFLLHDLPKQIGEGKFKGNIFVEADVEREVGHLIVEKWCRVERAKMHEGLPHLPFKKWFFANYSIPYPFH